VAVVVCFAVFAFGLGHISTTSRQNGVNFHRKTICTLLSGRAQAFITNANLLMADSVNYDSLTSINVADLISAASEDIALYELCCGRPKIKLDSLIKE
jgi:hypothetical protein